MRLLVILLTAAALLAGCGDDDGDEGGSGGGGATKPTAQPASGDEVSGGDRFTIRLADGWSDKTSETDLGSVKPELVIVGPRDEGFAANVNVIREPVPTGADIGDAAKTFQEQAKGLGGRNVHAVDAPALGGEEARAHEFDRTEGSTEITQRQVYAIRDKSLYTVTFSTTTAAAAEQRPAFDAMLASWTWK